MSTTITVSNAAELTSALASATGGETILLEGGNYGTVKLIGYDFPDYVTIKSADPDDPAEMGFFRLQDSSYVRVEGIHFSGVQVTGGVGAVNLNDGHHIQFHNNVISGGDTGLKAGNIDFLEVVGNTVDNVGEQSYKFWGVHDFLIENNFGAKAHFPEPESHQDFIQFAGSSSNGVVRGNVFLPDYTGNKIIQGVFLDNGSYSNITIEQNLIYTTAVNGIGTGASFVGSNVVANHNTVLNVPGYGYHTTYVTLPGTGNVTNAGGAVSTSSTTIPARPISTIRSIRTRWPGWARRSKTSARCRADRRTSGPVWAPKRGIAELLAEGSGSGGTPGNTAPDAVNDSASTSEDVAVTISEQNLLANDSDADGDSLTIVSVNGASNGDAVLNADGSITFTPDEDFNGTGSFSYQVSDGNGGTDTATVTVDVTPSEDAPDAFDDTVSVDAIAPVTIDVLRNDSDPDGDSVQVVGVSQGISGSVAINADGTLTYTPYPWAFQGTDVFTYTIS